MIINIIQKKLYGPDYTASTRKKFALYHTKSPGVSGTHLVDLRNTKGAIQCFSSDVFHS